MAAKPVIPAAGYSFTTWQSTNPTDPLPGGSADTELEQLRDSEQEIIDWVATALSDAGALKADTVDPDTLTAATLSLFTAGWNYQGDWVTLTDYVVGDAVRDTVSGNFFLCMTAHTAAGTFATDSASGYWSLLATALPLAITEGGTGGTTAAAARANLGTHRPVQSKATNYTQVASDLNNMILWSAVGEYALLPAATAGNDFQVDIFASGAQVTINPDGAELVNGSATVAVPLGESGTLFCDGSAWWFLAGGGGGGGGGGLFKGDNGEVGSAPGDIFRVNNQTLTVDTTIDADENASCTGPLTVQSGKTLTVASGGRLVIL